MGFFFQIGNKAAPNANILQIFQTHISTILFIMHMLLHKQSFSTIDRMCVLYTPYFQMFLAKKDRAN